MADGFSVKIDVTDVKRALSEASSTIRTKAVRGALREAGKVIQGAARASAPVLSAPTKNRKPGTIKRNIVVRNSKFARQAGNEGVYVSVRGINAKRARKLGKAGATNPNDPYYWKFLEMGTKKMAARPFMRPAAETKAAEAVNKFMQSVIPKIEKLNRRK